jgi:hypothetical protein
MGFVTQAEKSAFRQQFCNTGFDGFSFIFFFTDQW